MAGTLHPCPWGPTVLGGIRKQIVHVAWLSTAKCTRCLGQKENLQAWGVSRGFLGIKSELSSEGWTWHTLVNRGEVVLKAQRVARWASAKGHSQQCWEAKLEAGQEMLVMGWQPGREDPGTFGTHCSWNPRERKKYNSLACLEPRGLRELGVRVWNVQMTKDDPVGLTPSYC